MRRFVSFAVTFGITFAAFGGIGLPRPSGPRSAAAQLTAQSGPARANPSPHTHGLKPVRYAGYTIQVPASWPVYRLDRDPGQCVRYDRHAVYLGLPGASQRCPAHLVGRTPRSACKRAAAVRSRPGPPVAASSADPPSAACPRSAAS